MSEVVVAPGSQSGTSFGLEIISTSPARIIQNDPSGVIAAYGGPAPVKIIVTSTQPTPYRLQGSAGKDIMIGGLGADALYGDSEKDTLAGGEGNDYISGGSGNDLIQAGIGADNITGGEDNDIIYGGDGNDILMGDAGNDVVYGEKGGDLVYGGDGNDVLYGGAGNDLIAGGSGKDILIPGSGRNVMKGGAGADTFRFDKDTTVGKVGVNVIQDFNPAQDKIEISRALLPGFGDIKKLTSDTFEVVKNVDAASSGVKIVYERSTGVVYYHPASGVDVALFQIGKNLDLTADRLQIGFKGDVKF